MSLLKSLGGAGASASAKLYPEDVFSAYLSTGNGTTQTINNGIDLAGKGGMVWIKSRSNAIDNYVYDSARGTGNGLCTNATRANEAGTGMGAFSSTGWSMDSGTYHNQSPYTYASWTFAKAPKFFDIITWTGDNTATGRVIPHALAQTVGMVTVKATSTTSDWYTWHRATTSGNYLKLNTTASQSATLASTYFGNGTTTVDPTSTGITVGLGLNANGVTYVAYLYAHDTSADGIIQCGSFTTDSGTLATVTLGWEPQYLMAKSISSGTWFIYDTARGWTMKKDGELYANSSDAEFALGSYGNPTATGFYIENFAASQTFIYMAIRRPMKTPTSGTQVYNAIARTGTGTVATVTGVGFAPDLVATKRRTGADDGMFFDRLRGANLPIYPAYTLAEYSATQYLNSFDMDGVTLGTNTPNTNTYSYINHFFKRAKGFFDIVCYTATGVAGTVNHNLGVVPELMIVKRRSSGTVSWYVYNQTIGATKYLKLDTTDGIQAWSDTDNFNGTTPTSSVFSLGAGLFTNASASTYVSYLFATLAGISKVGSYTGNGTSINLDMGFTTGARFFLVKRTDSAGDWYIFDTVRGIVSGNDPHLSLNTTSAEVTTDDSVDPYSLGLTVNQVSATNINVNSATYIYLAIA